MPRFPRAPGPPGPRLNEPKDSRPDSDADREAALSAWERGEMRVGDELAPSKDALRRMLRDAPSDEDGYVAPPRRSVFPPSFLAVLAGCLAVLAVEPSVDLGWHLFGPTESIDLGEPANYRFDDLADGQRVRLEGIASPRRGSYTRWGEEWEAFALIGTPLLVRREPGPRPDANAAELVTVEGRLMRLDASGSGFVERLLRPAARFTPLKLTFEARGELPPGRDVFLVLDGELPRSSLSSILLPFVLWGLCLLVAVSAVRATLRRRADRARALRPS